MTRIIRSLLRVLPILATCITIVNAEDFSEMITVPEDPSQPADAVPFDETELIRAQDPQINTRSPAMLEDGTASPDHSDKKSPAMLENRDDDDIYPNGKCTRRGLYRDSPDDTICRGQYRVYDDTIFASRKSTCSLFGTRRMITCQLCYRARPYHHAQEYDPHAAQKFWVSCPEGHRCLQDRAWNRWGQYTPRSYCVTRSSIKDILIRTGSEIKKYCTTKVRFPGAGTKGTAQPTRFHAWLVNPDTGFYKQARKLYLYVNDRLITAPEETDDLTYTYRIKSTDNIRMCVFPENTAWNLELLFTGTILK